MKILCSSRPPVRYERAEPEVIEVKVEDERLLFDCNSLALGRLEKGESVLSALDSCPDPHFAFPGRPRYDLVKFNKARTIVFETRACNLRCAYCFVWQQYSDAGQGLMKFELAKRFIDEYLDPDPQVPVGIGFFGGEPTLAWDTLVKIVEYYEEWLKKCGKNIGQCRTVSLTTNGTLLKGEMVDWMVQHNVGLLVSLDGPQQMHDRYRKDARGSGSYGQVMAGLELIRNRRYGHRVLLRSTYTAGDSHLRERLEFLNNLCDRGYGGWVSVEPALLSESRCADRGKASLAAHDMRTSAAELKEAAEWYVSRVINSMQPRYHHFAKPIERLLWCIPSPSECFSGDTKISLLDGTEKPLAELEGQKVEVYGYDLGSQSIIPTSGTCRSYGEAQLMEVELDGGERVRCTPDHPWLLRDGSTVSAIELVPGASLAPLYRRVDQVGYEEVLQPSGSWVATHKMVLPWRMGPRGRVLRHHKNFNKRDNRSSNLEWLTWEQHADIHSLNGRELIVKYNKSAKHRAVASAFMKKLNANPTAAMLAANRRKLEQQRRDPGSALNRWLHSDEHISRLRRQSREAALIAAKVIAKGAKEPGTPTWNWLHSERNCSHLAVIAGRPRPSKKGKFACEKCGREFDSLRGAAVHKARCRNHVVVNVRMLEVQERVYCLEMDRYHYFALSAGIFVKNCGAGNGYLSLSQDGRISACHRQEMTYIGSLDGGIDPEKQAPWRDNRWEANLKCRKCPFRNLCGGPCRETNILFGGDIREPCSLICEFNRLRFLYSMWIIAKVGPKILRGFVQNPRRGSEVLSGAGSGRAR